MGSGKRTILTPQTWTDKTHTLSTPVSISVLVCDLCQTDACICKDRQPLVLTYCSCTVKVRAELRTSKRTKRHKTGRGSGFNNMMGMWGKIKKHAAGVNAEHRVGAQRWGREMVESTIEKSKCSRDRDDNENLCFYRRNPSDLWMFKLLLLIVRGWDYIHFPF